MEPTPAIRLDKWLFHARFFKTRSLAAKTVTDGGIRVNGTRVSKPSASVRVGDRLTFSQGDAVRVVDVVAHGTRRGPAPEAQALYTDHSPPRPPRQPQAPRYDKGGRPTKRDRRQMDRIGPEDS
ncbi:Heat shock protein 15 [Rhodobacteraceae bacterium THAF1]|uniref:RNA-binding S4 domain-containing protein n=1 Tax=Palleronia sp. THAF1 TaxID=2587842 RepID=UPI000F4088D4|nr:RNA-binding S4 domain-containing protein [Palleronia sp. THAF1]QFU08649.1 Heat shock protein 15 [Palleronia sp. THAF1]VDC28395.1 Heat shock protein 15 [Rhodobacteraceae bacterium THAF1]